MLLVLYPAVYRREYGRHMLQVFRDICRDSYRRNGTWGVFELWLSALLDLFITVIEQHRQEGIRMPMYILSRFSGLILMVAGVLAGLVSISQLQPGSHYSFHGIYKVSIDLLLPAYVLLGLGLVGLSLRYRGHFNRTSRTLLLIALLGALATGIARLYNWNIVILGWFVHFLFIALLGFSLRRQNILAPYNIVMTLLGAVPFALTLSALIISTRTGGSDGPQLGAFAVMLGIGLGWLIIGYGVHSEKTRPAMALT
jgi:hypothetical protein